MVEVAEDDAGRRGQLLERLGDGKRPPENEGHVSCVSRDGLQVVMEE